MQHSNSQQFCLRLLRVVLLVWTHNQLFWALDGMMVIYIYFWFKLFCLLSPSLSSEIGLPWQAIKLLVITLQRHLQPSNLTFYSTYWPGYLLSVKFLYVSLCGLFLYNISDRTWFESKVKINENKQIKAPWALFLNYF